MHVVMYYFANHLYLSTRHFVLMDSMKTMYSFESKIKKGYLHFDQLFLQNIAEHIYSAKTILYSWEYT